MRCSESDRLRSGATFGFAPAVRGITLATEWEVFQTDPDDVCRLSPDL
jgi:hypothetical protein